MSGAWYILDGERIGQGREKAIAFLGEHPDIREALRARLLTAMRSVVPPIAPSDDVLEVAA